MIGEHGVRQSTVGMQTSGLGVTSQELVSQEPAELQTVLLILLLVVGRLIRVEPYGTLVALLRPELSIAAAGPEGELIDADRYDSRAAWGYGAGHVAAAPRPMNGPMTCPSECGNKGWEKTLPGCHWALGLRWNLVSLFFSAPRETREKTAACVDGWTDPCCNSLLPSRSAFSLKTQTCAAGCSLDLRDGHEDAGRCSSRTRRLWAAACKRKNIYLGIYAIPLARGQLAVVNGCRLGGADAQTCEWDGIRPHNPPATW